MQAIRINNRLPQVYRACKATPTYYPTRTMSLFPRFVASEFAPMFRLLDDYAAHANAVSRSTGFRSNNSSLRSFQPRFDVKETKEGYELHGELPGIDQKDINIEFTDAHTLSIKGRTEQVREEGRQPEQAKITHNETESHGYRQASVEVDTTVSGGESAAAETTSETTPAASETQEVTPAPQQPKPDSARYWVSERSVGEFARTFSFPSRVDQENVRASLKNGILSVVVPKAAAPVSRRINIE